MNIFQTFISPSLYKALEPYRITEDEMVWAYSVKNPDQRQNHGDWFALKGTPRIDGARKTALPFRGVKGKFIKDAVQWDVSYPGGFPPGLLIENRPKWDVVKSQIVPHAWIDRQVTGSGWATWECYLPKTQEWVFAGKTYSGPLLFGKRLKAYYGYKQDVTVGFDENFKPKSDMLGWIDPPSMSFTRSS